MALKKKLITVGNSRALVLDKPLLEALHVEADTEFEISIQGQALLLRPLIEPRAEPRAEIVESITRVRAKHRKALDRLA
jgi:antitoxin component of MazEF toxin-antitoxin module